jgi:hypothetical protein
MTLYPDGYGTAEITLEQMVAKHGPKQHPEFARRFFAWIVSEGGRMGVGGGWRATQPVKPGFAPPGMSFHETQTFASGFAGYAAVDLVHRQPGQVHRSPTWAETASAREFGLHTFVTGEPWHIQCIEMRGYAMWVNAGRPDPQPIALPGDKPSPPPIDPTAPPIQELPMKYYALPPTTDGNRAHIVVIDGACRYRCNGDTDELPEIRLPEEQYVQLRKSAGLGPG